MIVLDRSIDFMEKKECIKMVHARQILDSRGNPTVEITVTLEDGTNADARVPSGASTGKYEALELRDHDSESYGGKGVKQAVANVNQELNALLKGENVKQQELLDRKMINLDGTPDKSRLGANSILAVSMGCAFAAAKGLDLPLYRYLGGVDAKRMPVPMSNVLNGGAHTDTGLDFQEFMIMPVGAGNYSDGLRMICGIYHTLKQILKEKGMATAVGDEGGFAPEVNDAVEALELLDEAVRRTGLTPGREIVYAMDAAASELYREDSHTYCFPGESRMTGTSVVRTTEEMILYYEALVSRFALVSIEDGLAEEDWDGWVELTKRLGGSVQLVGDDLFTTNPTRLRTGIAKRAANAILIKLNQIGTVSETMETIRIAREAGYGVIVSHRSGETEDTFIADLAVAVNAGQIKTGAPCRSDRTAKYNRLLRIEEELGICAQYSCPFSKKDIENCK